MGTFGRTSATPYKIDINCSLDNIILCLMMISLIRLAIDSTHVWECV